MLTFVGLLVIAVVLYDGLRRLNRMVYGVGLIFERMANRAAEARGEPPVITPEDINAIQ